MSVNRILIVTILIIMLLPLWFLFTGSFQDVYGVLRMPPQLIPRNPTLVNYDWVFQQPLLGWLRNTGIVLVCGVTGSVIVSSMGGYAFAFYRFPGRNLLWLLLLAGIMIPRMSMVIPRFVVIRKMALSGTLWAAILPLIYHPVALYLSRAYFESVPYSLIESARLDGAGELTILARVIGPISRPIITAIALFASIQALGDYLWQLLQLQRPQVQTLLIGLMRQVMVRGGEETSVNPIGKSLAVAVVLLLPMLVVFLTANRYFTTALQGAIKE